MKKLLLFVLALGVALPALAAPGHRMPPPPHKDWHMNMLDEDWDARFVRYEKKIKRLVRAYKHQRPGSYKAAEIKKDLSKEIARLRKDQLAMKKENLRSFQRDIKDLQKGLAEDQKVYRRRWVFLDARARAVFAHQINVRRHSLHNFKMQVADLERELARESRSSSRARWVARKTVAAIKFNGDMRVFFDDDMLFAPRGMSMLPPPGPGPAVKPGPKGPSHRPAMRPGSKGPAPRQPRVNKGPSSGSAPESTDEDKPGVELGPTGNKPAEEAPSEDKPAEEGQK